MPTQTKPTPNRSAPSRSTRSRRTKRPRHTAAEAQSFDTYSPASIAQVQDAIDARAEDGIHEDCQCQPYIDTFVIGRWADQGYLVKKGEKALRISTFAKTGGKFEAENEAGEKEERDRLRAVTAKLFCRCQVWTRAAWEAARQAAAAA